MRIAEAYGPKLSVSSGAGAKTEPFAKLGYTQALILLGLPEEERVEFIKDFDLENMAVRELQQAVNDRNKAVAEKATLQQERDDQKNTISKLSDELDQANKEASDKQQALWDEQETVTKLQRKLDLLENDSAVTRRIAEIERESKITKINLSMAQADARFDLIAKGFDDLLIAINEMAVADPEAFKLYLIQTNQFIKKTSEKLKRIEKAASEVPAKPKPSAS